MFELPPIIYNKYGKIYLGEKETESAIRAEGFLKILEKFISQEKDKSYEEGVDYCNGEIKSALQSLKDKILDEIEYERWECRHTKEQSLENIKKILNL